MENIPLQFGYAGLFLVSFLAATLIPLSSEGAVLLMALSGFNPPTILLVATAGNSLGSLVNYFVGKWGGRFVFSRFIRVDPDARVRAEKTFGKWGTPALFFAWLPVVGDPLTLAAGTLRVRLTTFLFWVILGKALRYWFLLEGAASLVN